MIALFDVDDWINCFRFRCRKPSEPPQNGRFPTPSPASEFRLAGFSGCCSRTKESQDSFQECLPSLQSRQANCPFPENRTAPCFEPLPLP